MSKDDALERDRAPRKPSVDDMALLFRESSSSPSLSYTGGSNVTGGSSENARADDSPTRPLSAHRPGYKMFNGGLLRQLYATADESTSRVMHVANTIGDNVFKPSRKRPRPPPAEKGQATSDSFHRKLFEPWSALGANRMSSGNTARAFGSGRSLTHQSRSAHKLTRAPQLAERVAFHVCKVRNGIRQERVWQVDVEKRLIRNLTSSTGVKSFTVDERTKMEMYDVEGTTRGLRIEFPGQRTRLYDLEFSSLAENVSFVAAVHAAKCGASLESLRAADPASLVPKEEKVKICICTMNLGNAAPPDDLSPWIPRGDFHVYAVGVQECWYNSDQGAMSCEVDFFQRVEKRVGENYYRVHSRSLWEIRLIVLVRKDFLPAVTSVQGGSVATGILGVLGNKGGVGVVMKIHETVVGFVNSHLAAHQGKVIDRNQNARDILGNILVSDDEEILLRCRHVFFFGDLNYRLDFPSYEVAIDKLDKQHVTSLMEVDQLKRELRHPTSVWANFSEPESLNFFPTFKLYRPRTFEQWSTCVNGTCTSNSNKSSRNDSQVSQATDVSSSSNMSPSFSSVFNSTRIPSYCDRILVHSHRRGDEAHVPADVVCTQYASAPAVTTSDHIPVYATFSMTCNLPYAPTVIKPRALCCVQVRSARAMFVKPSVHVDTPVASGFVDGISPPDGTHVYLELLADFVEGCHTSCVKKVSAHEANWEGPEVPLLRPFVHQLAFLRKQYVRVLIHDATGGVVGQAVLPLAKARVLSDDKASGHDASCHVFSQPVAEDGASTSLEPKDNTKPDSCANETVGGSNDCTPEIGDTCASDCANIDAEVAGANTAAGSVVVGGGGGCVDENGCGISVTLRCKGAVVGTLWADLAFELTPLPTLEPYEETLQSQSQPQSHSRRSSVVSSSSCDLDGGTKKALKGPWMHDAQVTACCRCGKRFTSIRRRHHCRYCGSIFCGDCAGRFVVPPESATGARVRVCIDCATAIEDEVGIQALAENNSSTPGIGVENKEAPGDMSDEASVRLSASSSSSTTLDRPRGECEGSQPPDRATTISMGQLSTIKEVAPESPSSGRTEVSQEKQVQPAEKNEKGKTSESVEKHGSSLRHRRRAGVQSCRTAPTSASHVPSARGPGAPNVVQETVDKNGISHSMAPESGILTSAEIVSDETNHDDDVVSILRSRLQDMICLWEQDVSLDTVRLLAILLFAAATAVIMSASPELPHDGVATSNEELQ